MKRAMWAAILLAAAVCTVEAQQTGKSVPAPGPAPSTNYVWVVCNQGNTVAIRDGGGGAVITLQGGGFGFAAPYDIVGSPLHRRVFISNNTGAGTVTVIDSDTLQVLRVVPVPGSVNLRGLSLSEDQSTVFVAGEDPTGGTGGPAVFQIDAVSLADGTKTASIVDPGFGAEDCEVIRRGNVGGGGDAPGKVYFSVQVTGSSPDGYIGVIDLIGTVTVTRINAGAGPLINVRRPDRMQRTADHRFVGIGCTKIPGTEGVGPFGVRTIMITTATDAASAPAFLNDADVPNQVIDVTWRSESGGLNRGFVLALVSGVRSIFEIFDTGAFKAGPVSTAGVTQAITLRFASSIEQVFLGDISGTGQGYQAYDAKSGSVLTVANTPTSVGVRCQAFAVMNTPACVITDICPRGALASAGNNVVTVHGSGFSPLSSYGGAAAIPVGFIDSNTVTVNLGGATAATLGLTINNPNFQNGTIDTIFRRYTPEVAGSFPITVPRATAGGYQMFSVPQYLSLTAFKAALAAAFGPYNPVTYRVFFYRGGRYVELNALKDDGCDLAGEAFWMISRDGGAVTFGGPDVFANAGGNSRVIPINPGFNMISVPMDNGGASSGAFWANILVTDVPSDFATAQGTTTPFGQGILAPAALEFVNGSYVAADPLISGRGYWVENITSRPAYLLYSTTAIFKPQVPSAAAGGPPPAGMKPPPPPSAGIGESSGGVCGFTGLEGLLLLLAVRGFPRRRPDRKLVA